MGALSKRLHGSARTIASIALVVVALLCAWLGYVHGGYYVADWGLAAFIMAALIAAAAFAGVLGGARSLWGVAATSLFIGYAAWTFISILWSANRGDAWSGAGLTLLYLLAFWVSTTLVAMGASRRWTLAAMAIGPGVVAALTVPGLVSQTEELFELSRLQGSAGYFNSQAALLLVSFWISMYVAGSRRIPPALRAAALASAMLGVQVAALTQSRGAMVALAVSLPVFFLLSGHRLRALIALAPVAAFLFVAFPDLNRVYLEMQSGGSEQSAAAIDRATLVIWVMAFEAGIYGFVWSVLDRKWRPSGELARAAGGAALAFTVVVIIAGNLLIVDRVGNPADWVEDRWTAFTTNDVSGQDDSRFLSAGGSGRYTLWQVAWRDFTENPILGVGTHNYEATYYQYREENVNWVRQPHMLPLEVLAERGIVGGILFFGFAGTCLAAGMWKRFSNLNAEGKAQAGALLAAATYWFVHSSAEWFWQIPAVTLPAMIFLAMLVAPWKRLRDDEDVFAPSNRPLRLAGAGLAVLTLAVVGPLYAADRFRENAQTQENPLLAMRGFERAQAMNPLDPNLARLEGDLAFQIGDVPRATQSYARAIRLNPEHYAPYSVLGGLYEQIGQPQRALPLYRKSLQLNPLDPSLEENIVRVEEQLARRSEEGREESEG